MTITIRNYKPDDFDAVISAVNSVARGDTTHMVNPDDLREAFEETGYDPMRDGFVACTETGTIIGFRRFRMRQKRHDPVPIMESDGAVHPDYFEQGVPQMLIERLIERCTEAARNMGESGFIFQVRCFEEDLPMITLLNRLGFTFNRHLVVMERPTMKDIEQPIFPNHIDLRPYRIGIDDEGWYAALEEAFDQHWGQMVMFFAQWQQIVHRGDYNPNLSLIAWDVNTNEIAGFSYNKIKGENGTLRWLGVRPRWRRQGLANALTRAGLWAMREAGAKRAFTGADYQSDTGPARIYERNGFIITRNQHVFRCEFSF